MILDANNHELRIWRPQYPSNISANLRPWIGRTVHISCWPFAWIHRGVDNKGYGWSSIAYWGFVMELMKSIPEDELFKLPNKQTEGIK